MARRLDACHRSPRWNGLYRGIALGSAHTELTDEAISFVTRNQTKPFFLNLWYFSPHLPLHVPAGFDNKPFGYDLATPQGQTSAMISDVDREIGRLVDAIDSLQLSSNTLIVVVSDNGGIPQGRWAPATERPGIRGCKELLYEGGIRVPMIARWTGRIAPNTINLSQASTLDLFPTFVEAAAGLPVPGLEGRSLYPNLVNQTRNNGPTMFWIAARFDTYSKIVQEGASLDDLDQYAVRWGKYKLVRGRHEGPGLFDLSAGTEGEFQDISKENPALMADLTRRYRDWHKVVGTIPIYARVVNQVPQILFDPRLDFADGDFTFCAQVRAAQLEHEGIIAVRDGSWELKWQAGRVVLTLYDDRPGVLLADRATRLESELLSANQTYHVAFSVSGHLADNHIPSLYIDKCLAARILPDEFGPGQGLRAVAPNNAPIFLGSNGDGTEPFLGSMSVLKLSTLVLNESEL